MPGASTGTAPPEPRFLTADNASPFTLDGTRSYVVGVDRVAIIDPGPESEPHVAALAATVAGATEVRVVVTHGHRDHAPGAAPLAEAVGADVWGPAGVAGVTRIVGEGDSIPTDVGELLAVDTPGHARPHLAFHWPARRALFVGDLLLGHGATTWVGEYPGCVAEYLASLEKVRAFGVDVMYPAHGPRVDDPEALIDRYRQHRLDRIEQVAEALAADPRATDSALMDAVYGGRVPEAFGDAVLMSVAALREHVETHGG